MNTSANRGTLLFENRDPTAIIADDLGLIVLTYDSANAISRADPLNIEVSCNWTTSRAYISLFHRKQSLEFVLTPFPCDLP
jgi:hypothetical protein